MEYFDWADAKKAKLRAERGIGFEDRLPHRARRPGRRSRNSRTPTVTLASIFVVRRGATRTCPRFSADVHTVFLKTIIPSRKPTKPYLGEESDDEELTPMRRSCLTPSSAANGSPPRAASANGRATPDTRRLRSGRIGG